MAPARHNLTRRALLGAGVGAPLALAAARPGERLVPFGVRSACAGPVEDPSAPSAPFPQAKEGPGRTGGGDRGREQTAARRRWQRALAGYARAEARLADLRAHIESLPPEARAFPACEPLDDRFDDLECARLAALRRLLRLRAPDLPALALKIHRIVDDQAWELTGAEPAFAVLKADARRLCGG